MDIEQFIRDNYIQMSDKAIAKRFPVSDQYINKLRNRMGLKSPRNLTYRDNLTQLERFAKCYELWINGVQIPELSKRLNVSYGHVSKMISSFLPCRSEDRITITLKSKINGD